MLGGFFPGYYYHSQMDNRTVTVKGLVEQDVVADLALLSIRFQSAGNDLLAAKKILKINKKVRVVSTIEYFLK